MFDRFSALLECIYLNNLTNSYEWLFALGLKCTIQTRTCVMICNNQSINRFQSATVTSQETEGSYEWWMMNDKLFQFFRPNLFLISTYLRVSHGLAWWLASLYKTNKIEGKKIWTKYSSSFWGTLGWGLKNKSARNY